MSCNQLGFRPGYSTDIAAVRLVDHLVLEMDSGKNPMTIFKDLSKAVDTLSYYILLSKLR